MADRKRAVTGGGEFLKSSTSYLIFGGFILLAAAWEKLYRAQRENKLATTGAYAYLRHPQYVAFILIMFGFLLQWATILTLLMFPVLVWMYARLAKSEEREARQQFGEEYEIYAARLSVTLSAERSGCPDCRLTRGSNRWAFCL